MKKLLNFTVIFLLITVHVGAQNKTITQEGQLWLGYFNQSRYSDKWGSWLDVHLRTREEVFQGWSQFLVRAGVTYYASERLKLTAGYVYANNYPSQRNSGVTWPEHRFWQQVQWQNQYPRLRFTQAIRLEQRFLHKTLNDKELAPGYNFNYRIRYNTVLNLPLNKTKWVANTIALIVSDEIFINFGKQIVYNHFDQNRFFAGLSWYVNSHDHFQLGYMNSFQQSASGNSFRSRHILRIYFTQHMDWRKPQKKAAEVH